MGVKLRTTSQSLSPPFLLPGAIRWPIPLGVMGGEVLHATRSLSPPLLVPAKIGDGGTCPLTPRPVHGLTMNSRGVPGKACATKWWLLAKVYLPSVRTRWRPHTSPRRFPGEPLAGCCGRHGYAAAILTQMVDSAPHLFPHFRRRSGGQNFLGVDSSPKSQFTSILPLKAFCNHICR